MPFIKPKTLPFATEEEALVFIRKNSFYEFVFIIKKYFHNMVNLYSKLCLFLFPVYLGLASIVLLFDYNLINYKLYLFLNFIYIPVQNPYGWNVSFILAFVFNLLSFVIVTKNYNFKIMRNIIYIHRPIECFFACLPLLLVMAFFIYASLVLTLPVKSNSCIRASLCELHSDSMFFYSSLLLYFLFWGKTIVLFSIFYGQKVNFNIVNLKDKYYGTNKSKC